MYDILSQSRALFYLNFIIIAPSSLRHATKHIPPAQVTSTTGGRTETRTYNAFNQLTQVTAPDLAASYLYRADGLRRSKTVNGVVTTHVWDRGQIVLETGANTAVVINRFNRCLGGRLILSPQFGWYLYDARGSVVQRTVNQGGILHNYRYTAFGNAITAPNSVASTNPFRFNGMYWDAHRGEYMTPNRMFNPRLGRWTQPDPFFHMRFGQARMMGSPRAIAQSGNLFMFTMHNPVRWADPTGLFAIPATGPILQRRQSLFVSMSITTSISSMMDMDSSGDAEDAPSRAAAAANRIAGSSASSALRGLSILIDPGHGGSDPGTHGFLNGRRIDESYMNMNVSFYLRTILRAMGADVSMTHGGNSTQSAVAARYRNVQYGNPDLVVSIHFNSHGNRDANGIEILHRRNCNASVHLATYVFDSLAEQTQFSGTSRYAPIFPFGHPVLNNSQVPAILVEPGFMSNAADMHFMYHNQFSIAEAIAHGIFNSRQ